MSAGAALGVVEAAVSLAEDQLSTGGTAEVVLALKKLHLRLGDALAAAEAEIRPPTPDRKPRRSFVTEIVGDAAAAATEALLAEAPQLRRMAARRQRFLSRARGAWRRHRAVLEVVMGITTAGKLAALTASYYSGETTATWILRRVDWAANGVFCAEIGARLALRNTGADRFWCFVICPWAAGYWFLMRMTDGGYRKNELNADRTTSARTTMLLLDAFTGLAVFRLKVMQRQVVPILRALPAVLYPGLVLFLGLWMWSAVGFILLRDRHPAFFGTFQDAFFTMWQFLTDSAGGELARSLTHDCRDLPWGYLDPGAVDDRFDRGQSTTLRQFSHGEDLDDAVDCVPLYGEMGFFYSFEIVMAFLVLNVLLGVVVDAVATARADILDSEFAHPAGGDEGIGDDALEDDVPVYRPARKMTGRRLSVQSHRVTRVERAPAWSDEAKDAKDAERVAPAEFAQSAVEAFSPTTPVVPIDPPADPTAPASRLQTRRGPAPRRQDVAGHGRRAAAVPAVGQARETVDRGVNGHRDTFHAPLDADFY